MLTVNEELNNIDFTSEKIKIYFSRRKQIKNIMKSINSYMDFNSQTYFLMLYYMDLIFTHKDLEKVFYSHFTLWYQYPIPNDLQMSNYILLSLACLITAAKFNENDSQVPTMSSFIRLLYEFSKKKYIFGLDYLFLAEIVVLKFLKYKLNYYTIYHYLIFFFTHGIVLRKTIQRSNIYKKLSERKILEKIYIKVREMFDELIDSEKYYEYYCGKNNYEIVVEILLWCTEYVLNERIGDDENIFKLVFGINIEQDKKKEIYNILEQLHIKIKKRNALNKSSRLIEIKRNNNNESNLKTSSRALPYHPPTSENDNTNNNNIRQKSSITNPINPSSTNINSLGQYTNLTQRKKIYNNNDFFNYVNKTIQNEELNNINQNDNDNYSYKIINSFNSGNKIYNQLSQISNIKYGQNNRVYLTSDKNKEMNSMFNINSIDNSKIKNNTDEKLLNTCNDDIVKKSYCSSRVVKIYPFQMEKQPIDSQKELNENPRKIILINRTNHNFKSNQSDIKKKSLSCSKNLVNYDRNNDRYYPKENTYVVHKYKNKIKKFEENINNIKIEPPESSKNLNNYLFSLRNNEQNSEQKEINNKPLSQKEIIVPTNQKKITEYKEYLLPKNIKQKNQLYGNDINNLYIDKKIIKDNIVHRTKYSDINKNIVTKLNSTLELGPKDNHKKISNKYYIDSGNKNIINNNMNLNNNSNNRANTIIINNNIQINNLIDDKSKNLYFVHNDGIRENFEKINNNKYRNSYNITESKAISYNFNRVNNAF